jgi:hypothetical protein
MLNLLRLPLLLFAALFIGYLYAHYQILRYKPVPVKEVGHCTLTPGKPRSFLNLHSYDGKPDVLIGLIDLDSSIYKPPFEDQVRELFPGDSDKEMGITIRFQPQITNLKKGTRHGY